MRAGVFKPMNCMSWNIGHLAWQEQRYWLFRAQGQMLLPEINERFAYGAPPSTPSLDEVWEAWQAITEAGDPWLDSATTQTLQSHITIDGKPTAVYLRVAASADDLPLLVSHGRERRDPPEPRARRLTRLRRRYRYGSAVPARVRLSACG